MPHTRDRSPDSLSPFAAHISSTEEIIDEAKNGRMFILIDDEDRENEGDLVIPAQFATADMVNFMTIYGRGLVCLALSPRQVEHLELPPMPVRNKSKYGTAFMASIEAAEGITTGISAADRAQTIAVAIRNDVRWDEIRTPGHIFPLRSREGGTLIRPGHTEAAVDIARLAGLNPAGVICEIMNDDGTMARLPDLVAFARRHNMKLGTIAELIEYRRKSEARAERTETFDPYPAARPRRERLACP